MSAKLVKINDKIHKSSVIINKKALFCLFLFFVMFFLITFEHWNFAGIGRLVFFMKGISNLCDGEKE